MARTYSQAQIGSAYNLAKKQGRGQQFLTALKSKGLSYGGTAGNISLTIGSNYKRPTQAVSKPKPKTLDSQAQSNAVISGQNASGTNTSINKPKVNTGGVSIPKVGGTTNSGKSNPNTSYNGNSLVNSTIKNTFSGSNSINNIANNITNNLKNKTFTTPGGTIVKTTTPVGTSQLSNSYNKFNDQFNSAMHKGLFTADNMNKYGGVESYSNKYNLNIDNQIKNGKLNQNEGDKLKGNFNNYISKKLGYTKPSDIVVKKGGVGSIGNSYSTTTDSKGRSYTRSSPININFDEITKKVASGIFGNDTFKNNFDSYIGQLKNTIETQKNSLDATNKQISSMYDQLDSTFQSQYGDILNSINQREADTKNRLATIESSAKQRLTDTTTTLGEQKAGEKQGIRDSLRAKGLTSGAISNALTGIDKKYNQTDRKNYSAYTTSMTDLANQYDKLAANIISNKSNLTANRRSFAESLVSKSKALLDASQQFNSTAISTLSKPLTDLYKARNAGDNIESGKVDQRNRIIDGYKSADQSMRLKILENRFIVLKSQGVNVSAISRDVLNTAAGIGNITDALTYIRESAYGTSSSGSSSSGASAIDSYIKALKPTASTDKTTTTKDSGSTDKTKTINNNIDTTKDNKVVSTNNTQKNFINTMSTKLDTPSFKKFSDIGRMIEGVKTSEDFKGLNKDLINQEINYLNDIYPGEGFSEFFRSIIKKKASEVINPVNTYLDNNKNTNVLDEVMKRNNSDNGTSNGVSNGTSISIEGDLKNKINKDLAPKPAFNSLFNL